MPAPEGANQPVYPFPQQGKYYGDGYYNGFPVGNCFVPFEGQEILVLGT